MYMYRYTKIHILWYKDQKIKLQKFLIFKHYKNQRK